MVDGLSCMSFWLPITDMPGNSTEVFSNAGRHSATPKAGYCAYSPKETVLYHHAGTNFLCSELPYI
jgi:hypothetical protein